MKVQHVIPDFEIVKSGKNYWDDGMMNIDL
jgi:hypothetical protein